MDNNNGFQEIADILRQAKCIGIACHMRPDGDAIGSIVGLGRSLQLAGLKVRIISEDGVPRNLTFLPGSDLVEKPNGEDLGIDVAVALDTAVKDRLGDNTNRAFSTANVLINIDHHGTNPRYGHLNYVDKESPATGQIVYELIKAGGFPLDEMIRQNLYAAISTDTGSFQYSATTAATHRIIAEMMDAGSEFSSLCQMIYHNHPFRHLLLQKDLLNRMQLRAENRIASWQLTHALQKEIGMQPGDTEGLIDTLRSIEGVISPVIFEEQADGSVRVSVRSKDQRLDVSKVCAEFGGGGHRMASGARLQGPINEAANKFLVVLEDEIKRLD